MNTNLKELRGLGAVRMPVDGNLGVTRCGNLASFASTWVKDLSGADFGPVEILLAISAHLGGPAEAGEALTRWIVENFERVDDALRAVQAARRHDKVGSSLGDDALDLLEAEVAALWCALTPVAWADDVEFGIMSLEMEFKRRRENWIGIWTNREHWTTWTRWWPPLWANLATAA